VQLLRGKLSHERGVGVGSMEWEQGVGISPFSAEWLDNLLSFLKKYL
jgi:hypothetical protein